MSSSDDSSQAPWADPQTHLDADPVNDEPSPAEKQDGEEDGS